MRGSQSTKIHSAIFLKFPFLSYKICINPPFVSPIIFLQINTHVAKIINGAKKTVSNEVKRVRHCRRYSQIYVVIRYASLNFSLHNFSPLIAWQAINFAREQCKRGTAIDRYQFYCKNLTVPLILLRHNGCG